MTIARLLPVPLLLGLALCSGAPLAAVPEDPWPMLRSSLLGEDAVVRESGISVQAPAVGENAAAVPVTVSFDPGLGQVDEFMVIVDHNPYPMVARVIPQVPFHEFSLRLRMERSGPIRAAARTADGIWHVAMKEVRVSGGGCSIASGTGSVRGRRHGQVNVAVFGRSDGTKMRMQLVHPMETGLAKDAEGTPIPPFYIYEVAVRSGGTLLYTIALSPVSKDPTFTTILDVDPVLLSDLSVSALDTEQEQFMSRKVMLRLDPDVAAQIRARTGEPIGASR